jgi:hypothetical protein
MVSIFIIDWDEFEEGWGPRPDGHSLHLTKKDAEVFMEKEIMAHTGIHTSDPSSQIYEEMVPPFVVDALLMSGGSMKIKNKPW